jgi:mono/diheme cytochrome c family protein
MTPSRKLSPSPSFRRAAGALAAVLLTLMLSLGVAATAVAQEPDASSESYQKSVRLVPRDTIALGAYQGWKQYELNCARCHGEFGVGTSFAPDLTMSLKSDGTVPDQAAFITVVCQGRKEKGMPSWCEVGLEMTKINDIYSYLKLRADGKVGAGRPAVKAEG